MVEAEEEEEVEDVDEVVEDRQEDKASFYKRMEEQLQFPLLMAEMNNTCEFNQCSFQIFGISSILACAPTLIIRYYESIVTNR